MFNSTDITTVHIEITSRCQASCPMCPRTNNPHLRLNDWTIEDFKTIFTKAVLQQLKLIYFCGNYGDPIINNDLPLMCQYIKDNAPHIQVDIHTNGSARSTEWWKTLHSHLPKKHTIVFALDGLADTHSIYRVGTSFDVVLQNASTFINEGGNAHWVMIRFKHNQHQVNDAKLMAKQYKFNKFSVKDTTRFGLQHTTLQPATDTQVVFFDVDVFKQSYKNASIDCYALKSKEIYIDADKHVYPCCYLAMGKYYNSHESELENIFTTQYEKTEHLFTDARLGLFECTSKWKNFDTFWKKDKLLQCVRVCGSTPLTKPTSQWS